MTGQYEKNRAGSCGIYLIAGGLLYGMYRLLTSGSRRQRRTETRIDNLEGVASEQTTPAQIGEVEFYVGPDDHRICLACGSGYATFQSNYCDACDDD